MPVVYKGKRFSVLISLAGALYAVVGFMIYLFQSKAFDFKNDFGLIISCIGIFIVFFGLITSQLLYRKPPYSGVMEFERVYSNEDKTDYDIVERWQIIEKIASEIMREQGSTENNSKSINSIFDFLSDELKDSKSINKLRALLKTRNRILHEFYKPSKSEKSELIDFSNTIIKTLENKRKSVNP